LHAVCLFFVLNRLLTWTCFRIFTIEDLSRNLLQDNISLAYTPRKFVRHPDQPLFYVIEADNNVLAPNTRAQLIADSNAVNGDATPLPPQEFGYPRGTGHWASCVQIIDPVSAKDVLFTLELENNECATSIAIAPFAGQDNEAFLVIGTAKDLVVNPRSHKGGFLHVYRFHEDGKELEFIHKTSVDEPPTALLAFQGKLLAGVGANLRIYDLGMKQMLRKAQVQAGTNVIVGLQTQGSRIIVSDSQESVTYCVYKYQENKLIPFADDVIARWTTSTAMVDYETVAGGDKFGNIWLLRCPQKASEEADEEGSGAHLLHERQYLSGAPNRLSLVTHYFPGDIPTSIQKTSLVAGGRDVIFWTGLQGTLGMLVPFVSREDVDFFQSLEMQLTSTTGNPPLLGRDHLMYRSYYAPSKGTIDGDLCETFFLLSSDKKQMIAGELDRTIREIERKISDMRTRVAY
jgi:splicing factor 3B subunit 3